MSEETSPASSPDTASDSGTPAEAASPKSSSPPSGPFLSWPPPGLEQIQGKLAAATAFLFLGSSVLVLPLLFSIGTRQSFTSLGAFGAAGWVVAFTTSCGLILLIEGFRRLFGIVRTGNRAIQQGHGWLTVLQAAADGPRDTGFLLQGARLYSGVSAAVRELLLRRRLTAAAATLAAALWTLAGFVLGIFLAARGILGPTGLWWFLFLPLSLLLLIAVLERFGAGLQARTLRRQTRDEVSRNLDGEIDAWRSQAGAFDLPGILGSGGPGRITPLRIVGAIASVVFLILLLPILIFTFMGTVMPSQMTEILPRFHRVQEKAIMVEFLRPYRLATDPALGREAAGIALRNLTCVGSRAHPYEHERAPQTDYPQPWNFGRNLRLPGTTAFTLLEKSTIDLTVEERQVLREEATNPAHGEFSIMARAGEADFLSTFYSLPLPDTLSWAEFPVPRFTGLLDGARAHIAKAAWELHNGRRSQAETTIREIISTGFLMIDEHPHLIGNLVGIVAAQLGGTALEEYYRIVGRTVEADRLATARYEIEHSLSLQSPARYTGGALSDLDFMSDIIMDRKMLRGLRWELVPWVTTGASFSNLNRAVFGPGEGYDLWLSQVHDELVRYPSEEELYHLVELGWVLSPADLEHRGFVEWLLGLTFGEPSAPGSFAALMRTFD